MGHHTDYLLFTAMTLYGDKYYEHKSLYALNRILLPRDERS